MIVDLAGKETVKANGLMQWDFGQTLEIYGLEELRNIEVHFSAAGREALIQMTTVENGIVKTAIPDSLLTLGKDIIAYVYIANNTNGKTIKTIKIPVERREKPTIWVGKEDNAIREAMDQIKENTEKAEQAASKADESKKLVLEEMERLDGLIQEVEEPNLSLEPKMLKTIAQPASGNLIFDCNGLKETFYRIKVVNTQGGSSFYNAITEGAYVIKGLLAHQKNGNMVNMTDFQVKFTQNNLTPIYEFEVMKGCNGVSVEFTKDDISPNFDLSIYEYSELEVREVFPKLSIKKENIKRGIIEKSMLSPNLLEKVEDRSLCEKSTALETKREIDGVKFDGTESITHYAMCSTSAATKSKLVNITGFTLGTGAKITVLFKNGIICENSTLNVSGTGEKPIHYNGMPLTSNYVKTNSTIEMVYDGSHWNIVGQSSTSGGNLGGKIIWRGALMAGGSAEFNVPEECFHNNGTTLTLLVDGYYRKGVAASGLGKNLDMTGATLCFGSAGDFGLTDHASDKYYAPYADDEGNAYVKIYRNDSVSSDTNAYLNMTIKAKKVPDTRYAVCTIAMNSDKYFNNAIVTCVSAIAPAEMEA